MMELEVEIGSGRLPEPYRDFLMRTNGGRPTPNLVKIDGIKGSVTDIDMFFGIREVEPTSDIRWNKKMFTEGRPKYVSYLPIAADGGNSIFCMNISGDHRIVMFDPFMDDPYFVASDFGALLAAVES